MSLTPVAFFVYNRLEATQLSINALSQNELSRETDLFIFSDGPRNDSQTEKVMAVRSFLKSISGFKSVTIYESNVNLGLAKSIITGVSKIISEYGKVIVLEDDLVTSSNFLPFMNRALDYYSNIDNIYSISGFTYPMKTISEDEVYFTLRASSWGWATWKNRWDKVDWEIKDYDSFKMDRTKKREFNLMGSDMTKMLNDQMTGKINSWAIRWCYNQFKTNQYTVFPAVSKVQNIGTTRDATNTKDNSGRFSTILDQSNRNSFTFREAVIESKTIREFTSRFSIFTRAKYKILNLIKKFR